MPKKIVMFDHDGTPAHVLYEVLVTGGYAVHFATQPERLFALFKEVQPDLVLLGWPALIRIEAELLASCETGALDENTPLFAIGVPRDIPLSATGDEFDRIFDEICEYFRISDRFRETKYDFFGVEKPSEIYDVVHLVNVELERPERSAAIAAGGQTRTYSYLTTGPQARPHLQWSLPFPEQISLCHPILVAGQQVYLLDSQGSLCACEADTGEVRWSFVPSRESDESEDERITAFCLQAESSIDLKRRLVYVASTRDRLYELDQDTGLVLHSWKTMLRETSLELIPCGWRGLLLVGFDRSQMFHPSCPSSLLAYSLFDEIHLGIPVTLEEYQEDKGQPLTLYDHADDTVLAYGEQMVTNSGDTDFAVIDIACGKEVWKDASVLDRFWDLDRPLLDRFMDLPQKVRKKEFYEGKITSVSDCNMPIEDETLYLWGRYLQLLEKEGGEKPATAMLWGEDYDEYSALFALDPVSGTIKWRYESSADLPWGPRQLVATAQQIFVVRADGIEAVDVQTHHQRWQWQADFSVHHALEASGLLYVVGTQGQIVALDLSSGQTRWTWQVEGEVLGKWSTVDHGTLYVATTHALYALRC